MKEKKGKQLGREGRGEKEKEKEEGGRGRRGKRITTLGECCTEIKMKKINKNVTANIST